MLRWHFVKSNQIEEKEELSVRYMWMASKETDEFDQRPTTFIENAGTSLKAAMDVARKYGVVKECVLPFKPPVLYPDRTQTFYAIAS